MQDTCNRLATKRVITTLSSASPLSAPQIQVEYNVWRTFLLRFVMPKVFLTVSDTPNQQVSSEKIYVLKTYNL